MPVKIFLSGDSLTRSFSSGVRDESNLLRLQRELREADQEFLFRAQTDPLRAQQLGENLEASRFRNQLNRQTQEAQANRIKAESVIAGSRAVIENQNANIRLDYEDLVRQRFQTNQRALIGQDIATFEANEINRASNAENFANAGPERQQRQQIQIERAKAAGIDTSKITQVDYNPKSRQTTVANISEMHRQGSAVINSLSPENMDRINAAHGVVADLDSGSAFDRFLASGGMRPEARAALRDDVAAPLNALEETTSRLATMSRELAQAKAELDAMRTERLKLQNDVQAERNRALKAQQPNPASSTAATAPPSAPAPETGEPDGGGTPQDNIQSITPFPEFDPGTPPVVGNDAASRIIQVNVASDTNMFEEVGLVPLVATAEGNSVEFDSGLGTPDVLGYTEEDGEQFPIYDYRGDHTKVFDALLHAESGKRQKDAKGRVVTSNKGAIGIAQVMPRTAREIAREIGVKWSDQRYRNDAQYNAMLGQAYFDKMRRMFKHTWLAVAAYNMGPGNTRRALKELGDPRRGDISLDRWLGLLPTVKPGLDETRDYVRSIRRRVAR